MVDVYRITEECEGTIGWYAKGNYTLEEVIEGIELEEGKEYFDPDGKKNLKIVHKYFRCLPVSKNDDLPFAYWLLDSKKGRGAFEVSVIYLDL